jgi:hypothetical protein
MIKTFFPVLERPSRDTPRHVARRLIVLFFIAFAFAGFSAPVAALDMEGPARDTPIGAGDKNTDGPVSNGVVNLKSGGTVTDGVIIGGATRTGNVNGSRVNVTGGAASASIHGGLAACSGDAKGNCATISDGTVKGYVFGGSVFYSGNASGNDVTISGGTISGVIHGAFSIYGDATGNGVTVDGAPIPKGAKEVGNIGIHGGLSASGDNFTGNAPNKNSDVALYVTGNFETVKFGHDGDANIASLDLTPTGAGVKGQTGHERT